VDDPRVVGLGGVFRAELDDVPGVFIAEHALVLRREAPGGDDIEEKDFEDIERTGEVHHGVEFAVPYVLLGGVGGDARQDAGILAQSQPAVCLLGQTGALRWVLCRSGSK